MPDLLGDFNALLDLALAEDLSTTGDVSSLAVFKDESACFRIISRQDAVIYGLWCLPLIAERLDSRIVVEVLVADGDRVQAGQKIARFRGPVAGILAAERTMLNFLGFLSGIASRTAEYVAIAREQGNTRILDTRKTVPGFRSLAKAAVLAGGGHNHRKGLYDMVMLKDNHIDAAGSITQAVAAVRQRWGSRYRIEVECRNLDDVREALRLQVEVIMLDNMDAEQCRQAVALRRQEFAGSAAAFEASGDMNAEKIRHYAGLGLEYISVGALTHSVRNVNVSLGLEEN